MSPAQGFRLILCSFKYCRCCATLHAVFDVSSTSKYKPDFWQRYSIPTRTALPLVLETVGDWIVFRQTGAGGYIAVARVDSVIADANRSGFHLAVISDYLPFTAPVPFHALGRYAEQDLRLIGRRIQIGQAIQGKPIRTLWPNDLHEIVTAGFRRAMRVSGAEVAVTREANGFAEDAEETLEWEPAPRSLQELFIKRHFRDANFRLDVCGRYGFKCAFTGMSLYDGQHYEVDAIHIRSVKDHGPDIVQNGVCANKTLHWAFDHHLISIDEAYRPLIAPRALPERYLRLFPALGRTINLPTSPSDWPEQAFLDRHRAVFRSKYGTSLAL